MGTLDQSGLQVQFMNALFSEASFDWEHLIASAMLCAASTLTHSTGASFDQKHLICDYRDGFKRNNEYCMYCYGSGGVATNVD